MLERIEAALSPRPAPRLFWPAVAAGLAALLFLAVMLRPDATSTPAAPEAPLVASINPAEKANPIPAVYDKASGEIRLAGPSPAPTGRSGELWLIGRDGVPHSLGLLGTGDRSTIKIAAPTQARIVPGVTLAISSEPQGGSPTGLPTGPILATGTLITL